MAGPFPVALAEADSAFEPRTLTRGGQTKSGAGFMRRSNSRRASREPSTSWGQVANSHVLRQVLLGQGETVTNGAAMPVRRSS